MTHSYADCRTSLCPHAESMVTVPVNERYTDADVHNFADGIAKLANAFAMESLAIKAQRTPS